MFERVLILFIKGLGHPLNLNGNKGPNCPILKKEDFSEMQMPTKISPLGQLQNHHVISDQGT